MKPKFKYITLYERSQHYGGPEEGGWYYDWYEPVSKPVRIKAKQPYSNCSLSKPIKRYEKIYKAIKAEAEEFGQYRYHGGIEALVENYPYEMKSRETPHYE